MSVDQAFSTLPIGSPELELLQLARGGARELGAELDRRRALEVCELRAAVLDQVVLGRSCPGASTTSALTVSPHFSSGTPMTATSATAGCENRAVLDLDR